MYTFGSFSQYLIPFGRLPSDVELVDWTGSPGRSGLSPEVNELSVVSQPSVLSIFLPCCFGILSSKLVLLSGVWSGFIPYRSVPFIDSILRSPEGSKVTEFFCFLTDALQRLSFSSSWPPSSSNQIFFSSVFDFFLSSVPQHSISCMIVGFTVHCNLVFHGTKHVGCLCSSCCNLNRMPSESSISGLFLRSRSRCCTSRTTRILYPHFLDSYDFDQCYLLSHRETWQQQTSRKTSFSDMQFMAFGFSTSTFDVLHIQLTP